MLKNVVAGLEDPRILTTDRRLAVMKDLLPILSESTVPAKDWALRGAHAAGSPNRPRLAQLSGRTHLGMAA